MVGIRKHNERGITLEMLSQSLIIKIAIDVRLLIISVIGISIMGLLNYWSMHVLYTCTYITCKTSILIMLILLGFFFGPRNYRILR